MKSLATTNLAILSLRLIQFFFAGVVVGIMGFFIKQQIIVGLLASSPYIFVLVVGVVTMLTQFIYCFSVRLLLAFAWDGALATGWLISFFWLLNFVQPLPCGWNAFNPFGSSQCGQTRSVLVIQIVLAILWYLTAVVGLFDYVKASRAKKPASKA